MSFPKRVIVRSIKSGSTSAQRKAFSETEATDPPSLIDDGFLMSGNQFVQMYFKRTVDDDDTVFTLRIWQWSDISGMWHEDDSIDVTGDDLALVEVQGNTRIAVQVESITPGGGEGPDPLIEGWIGLVVPV